MFYHISVGTHVFSPEHLVKIVRGNEATTNTFSVGQGVLNAVITYCLAFGSCYTQEYLNRKYGQNAGTRMATALEKAGKTTGINFNNERRVHNTVRSHRLVRLADEQGKGDDMIEQLFQGYFEEGRNIADVDVLLDLAQKVIHIPSRW